MSIQEFWAEARPAVRAEILQLAGVPKDAAATICRHDWADLSILTVAVLERGWSVTEHSTARMEA